jgi:hypothetical protein
MTFLVTAYGKPFTAGFGRIKLGNCIRSHLLFLASFALGAQIAILVDSFESRPGLGDTITRFVGDSVELLRRDSLHDLRAQR